MRSRKQSLQSLRASRQKRCIRVDRSGAAAVEFAAIFPVMLALLLPITDIALVTLRKIEAFQAMRGLMAYAQFNPPPDITNASSISAWAQSLSNRLPGYTITPQVLCGDAGSPCSSSNTASPKWVRLSTSVTVQPIVMSICPPPNGCNLVHTGRFQ